MNQTDTASILRKYLVYGHLLRPSQVRRRFVVLMHPRSGSTLLNSLLNSHPQMYCEGEIFGSATRFILPTSYLEARSIKAQKPVYGCKMTTWQLRTKQKLKDSRRFMHDLHRRGWKVVYLKRHNILRQALSIMVLEHRKALGHQKAYRYDPSQGPLELAKLHVDPEDLLRRLQSRESELAEARLLLHTVPHLPLVYEEDLLEPETHQRTANKLFDYLELPRVTVKTRLAKIGKDNLADTIGNHDEVAAALAHTRYAPMLHAR